MKSLALILVLGPFAAYFIWSIRAKRPDHIIAAAIANVLLWTAGPTLAVAIAGHLH